MTPFESVVEGFQSRWEDRERIAVAALALEVADLIQAQTGVDPGETDPLVRLFDQPKQRPIRDPAVRRMLPDVTTDEQVAAEFRRLTQTDLALAKIAGLRRLAKLLTADQRNVDHGLVIIPRAGVREIAAALTDLRLALAQRLGITTDEDTERIYEQLISGKLTGGPRTYWAIVYATASLAQETLVTAMIQELPTV